MAVGATRQNDQGHPVKTDRNAMTGMALLAYLGTASCKTHRPLDQPFKKESIFLTSKLLPTLRLTVVKVPILTPYGHMHSAKHIP